VLPGFVLQYPAKIEAEFAMEDIKYEVAHNLDEAWLNFEPDIPIRPLAGGPNPFYVQRPDNESERLKRGLLRPYYRPPKRFLSGHNGCGKSTELYRLAADTEINTKYWPVHFSIRHEADINSLDFKDVLLIIGTQLYIQYQDKSGKKLSHELLAELEAWRGKIEEEITSLRAGRMEGGLEARLSAGIAEIASKIRLEPKTRHEIRQVIERDINGLIEVINKITADIEAREKRPPLILIDDLDKPDLDTARGIFFERGQIMLRPTCPIIYTITSSLFYTPGFKLLDAEATFLPNVKLHDRDDQAARNAEGYYTLRTFVHRRMEANLITDEALDLAAKMSGGVFRELTRLMRSGIDLTLADGRTCIEVVDMQGAAAEIRDFYWRTLTAESRQILQHVRQYHEMPERGEREAELLKMLAVLEYANRVKWYDIHPVLHDLLDTFPVQTNGNDD
jgi:hypothetical protein